MRIHERSTENVRRSQNRPLRQAPIHENTDLEINPQLSSVFYNGRIPVEIKDAIFDSALTEYTKTGADDQYALDTNYTRPGYTGKRKVCINLLLLCRRTYMETYDKPATKKEHVFWHERHPPSATGGARPEVLYFRSMEPWQLALVREIHLFTQMYWTEDNLLDMCKKRFMQGLEKIKITFRRGDWWNNESNAPLCIDPHQGDASRMLYDAEARTRPEGGFLDMKWGYAFRQLKNLKELEMEFETSEDKLDELKFIVKRAQAWKFPAANDMVLSADGLQPETATWRGTLCYWSDQCPYCDLAGRCGELGTPTLKTCKERLQLMKENLGPMLTITSVRWRIAALENAI